MPENPVQLIKPRQGRPRTFGTKAKQRPSEKMYYHEWQMAEKRIRDLAKEVQRLEKEIADRYSLTD